VRINEPYASAFADANAGQRLVMAKDGQRPYCRSNLMTGSHIQADMRCFTPVLPGSKLREATLNPQG
jgi:hypothetical protein